MKIYIGSDHAGFELKRALVEHLKSKGHQVEDMGAYVLDNNDDYPDFIYPCAQKVAGDPDSLGIIIGGSGQGEAIVANKVKGIRAAVYYGGNPAVAILSKEHNNANILSLGARYLSENEAKAAVDLWLEIKFSGEERHIRRVEKIKKIEENLKR
ncbi:RpiB/LacA/LacB family sugar-phosphate isomerase [Candidatus Curtissbacteria bacterium]|nr:RpiB/LacA/LacB family sugar-phosphate isomerase [Candidatus Curtissbacteria bacterium]